MAVDVFLKIDGIDGESLDAKFSKQVEVLSYSYGAVHATSTGGSGMGAGKASVSDISITAYLDKSAPKLWQACVTNQVISTITLTARRGGGKAVIYLTLTLTNAHVSSFHLSGAQEIPMMSISFSFEKIKTEYFLQQADGSAVSTGAGTWSVKTNSAS